MGPMKLQVVANFNAKEIPAILILDTIVYVLMAMSLQLKNLKSVRAVPMSMNAYRDHFVKIMVLV